MATNSWIGNLLTGGAWGTAGNWSGGVPISTSNIDFNRAWTGDPTISTPNAAIAFTDITAGDTSGGPNQINITSGGASSIWTPVAGAFIDTTLVNQLIQFQPGFAGAVQLAKKGPGLLYASTGTGTPPVTHSGGWDVQGGGLGATVTGRLGTGPVTLAVGTQYGNVGGGAITLANNVTVLGDVYINAFPAWDGAARQSLTISGSVTLPATTAILNVGNTFASPVTLSGAITGTAGFTKAGAGDLTLTNTGNTVSGAVSFGAGASASNLNFGAFVSGTGSANVVPNITSLNVAARVWYNHYVGGASTFNNSITFTEGGAGFLGITGASTWSGAGIVFSAGQLVGLGPATPAGDRGLLLFTNEGFRNALITVNDFPTSVTFTSGASIAATMNQTIAVASGAAGGTYTTKFFIDGGPNVANTWTTKIAANQTAAPLVFQGGVARLTSASAQTTTLRVGGSNTQDNTISGPITDLSGKAIALTKEDAGRWILSGANTYTGTTSISASGGTLVAAANSALGTTGAVTVNTVSTLEIAATAISKASSTVTVGGTGDGGNGAIRSQSGTNTFTAANYVLTTAGTRIRVDADRLTLASAGAISGLLFGIEKTGAADLALTQTNSTYTGATTISAGKLVASKLAIVGAVSSLGQPALANATITMAPGTTLAHEGATADTTDRIIALNAVGTMTIESSGTGVGAVTLSGGSFTLPNGLNTIAFSGINSANNTCARTIADTTSATAVSKSGSNKWILSGSLTYTGATSCAAGTLNFGSTNRSLTGAVSVSGGTIENSTNTLATSGGVTMTGGTITAEIASTTTVTVNSGTTARLEPTNSANSYTGATAINASGKLEVVTDVDPEAPAAGKVLGNSAVTVGNGGEIITSANANQRGQMRYGGNLTFNSGAILRIGFAA